MNEPENKEICDAINEQRKDKGLPRIEFVSAGDQSDYGLEIVARNLLLEISIRRNGSIPPTMEMVK